jgi:hypothetical protein
MTLQLEIGQRQLNKHDEELCGDSIEVADAPESTIIVVSDGLGSGVKANILSSLTTKMAATMLIGGCTLEEVIDTLAHTLPVCEVRHLAYSTFTILQVKRDGRAYLAEYDTPAAFIGHGSELRGVERIERVVGERTVHETLFDLSLDDWVVIVSDGVPHAGIGGIWNLGWGWDKIGGYVKLAMGRGDDAQAVADEIGPLDFALPWLHLGLRLFHQFLQGGEAPGAAGAGLEGPNRCRLSSFRSFTRPTSRHPACPGLPRPFSEP